MDGSSLFSSQRETYTPIDTEREGKVRILVLQGERLRLVSGWGDGGLSAFLIWTTGVTYFRKRWM
jgi:hypothetical protein